MPDKKSVRSLSDLHKLIPGAEAPQKEEQSESMDRAVSLVTLHVLLEKKGRKGSGVTVINGFHHTTGDLKNLARDLKALCGAGGTVRDDAIEVQGDHREKIAAFLKEKGFRLKVHQY